VEQGSHTRLLREGGVYARLYERQQLRRELEEEDLPGPALEAER
jgi:hypothetical protein